MNWILSADRSEISRVFAIHLKRVNSARSSIEHCMSVKYLYTLPTAPLRRSSRKEQSCRNRRSLSLALRERCCKALNWKLPGLLGDPRGAFSNFAPTQLSSLPHSSRRSQYTRAGACAEKGELRRAISALSYEPLANTADLAVQDDLARLRPSLSTLATPVTYIESLAPATRTKSSDVIRAINRFDRISGAGPDGLYPSILQTLLKYSESEDLIYNLSVELTKFIQIFPVGKLPPDAAAHLKRPELLRFESPMRHSDPYHVVLPTAF